jgi:putative transposase
VFDAQAIDLLRGIFADVCSDAHATRVQMDGEDDHVHRLVQYPPKVAVSSLVKSLKGVSAEDPELTFTTASLSSLSFP